jgi:hypothetical protein
VYPIPVDVFSTVAASFCSYKITVHGFRLSTRYSAIIVQGWTSISAASFGGTLEPCKSFEVEMIKLYLN